MRTAHRHHRYEYVRSDTIIERRWEQITALGGIASIALLIGQLATWANPHFNDPVTKITDYYVKSQGMALASIGLWMRG